MIRSLFNNKIVYLLHLTATRDQAKALAVTLKAHPFNFTQCNTQRDIQRERETQRATVWERALAEHRGREGYTLMPIWSSEAFALLIFMLSAAHLLRHIKKLVSAQSGSESCCRDCPCWWRRLGKKVGKNMIKECRHNLTACLENFTRGQSANVRWKPNESLGKLLRGRNWDGDDGDGAFFCACACMSASMSVGVSVSMCRCVHLRDWEELSYTLGYSRFT